jgi:phospholipase C
MSTCTKWVDDGTIACTDWTEQAIGTCNRWADHGSSQCQSWKDQGSNQCQSWADHGSNQCQSWADNGYNSCCDWAPCSWFCDAFVWIANWVCQAWYWVANWVCQAWYWVANWVCQAWYWVARIVCVAFLWIVRVVCVVWSWIADWVCVAWDTARCAVRWVFRGQHIPSGPIKHVFVLMLENRAFDHMLGLAGIMGTDATTGRPTAVDGLTQGGPYENPNPNAGDGMVAASSPADFFFRNVAPDPGHEFNNALLQLCGYTRDNSGGIVLPTYPDAAGKYPLAEAIQENRNNSGFIGSYFGLEHQDGVTPNTTDPERIMRCFSPDQVPVITALAQEFAVCDHWFSSMPGPTWPNRFFIHAASSGGLDDSPSNLQTVSSALLNGYRFENGTIYDSLEDQCFDWNVFMGDELPQVFAISGMTDRRIEGHFDDFDDFSEALSDPDFSVPYIFIEPNYGNVLPTTPGDFTCGNSQHPLDDVTRGERLIKAVYETIRNSPHWNNSLLLVTYDEQGGFYDHVPPPAAVSPGDVISDESNNHHNFDFTQLGVRVPAIVISPLIPANLVDHTVYDHTSLLATVENLFGMGPLTNRDGQANTFSHLLSLPTPRADAPSTLPDPADSGFRCEDDAEDRIASSQSRLTISDRTRTLEPVMRSFLHVAFLRDYHHANVLAKPAILRRYLAITTRAEAVSYIQDVARRVPKPKKRLRRILAMMKRAVRRPKS